jgi:hypothetical protein
MNFSKVFDILLQPEVTDEQIKEVYDYSKKNQYTEGRFKVYMEDKLGFDLSDKEYKPTESEVKKLGKLLGNFTIREMIQVMENPKYDGKGKEKRTKKKRKARKTKNKRKKKKSGGADLGNLFKNIKTFTGYKKMYKALHKILHNYFRIEEIQPNQMKKHILDMKPMQYMDIFNNPKYH